jgi:hypothetical protein
VNTTIEACNDFYEHTCANIEENVSDLSKGIESDLQTVMVGICEIVSMNDLFTDNGRHSAQTHR